MVDNRAAIGIVFFDGDCNFCNRSVDFIFKNNKLKNLRYASLQSEFARTILPKKVYMDTDFSTMYFYQNKKLYSKSSAFLKLSKQLTLPYNFFYYAILVPKVIRDWVYSFVAKRRHKLVKKQTCRIMTTEESKFFIENSDDVKNYAHIF